METSQLQKLNELDRRKQIVEPTPNFLDTWACMMGEDKCPIKKQNAESEKQIDLLKHEIHAKQSEIESLNKRFDDALLKTKDGDQKFTDVVKQVKESILVKERDLTIAAKDAEIDRLSEDIKTIQEEKAKVLKAQEEFMTTGYEADIKFGDKFKRYQELIKKHDRLYSKVAHLEAMSNKLDLSIREKKAYEHELAGAINRMVVIANDLKQDVARLKVDKQRFTKVKAVTETGANPLQRLFWRHKKDESKA